MRETHIFTLTVSYWPSATAAGKRPVVAIGFPEGDQYYSPHDFHFRLAPSRADFAEMIGQLPWAKCWLDRGLRDDVDRSEWPIVDYMHKAAGSKILNAKGQVVGELQVRRYGVRENEGYDRSMAAVHVDNINGVVNRLPKAKRYAAKTAILDHENRIRELYLEKRPETAKARRAIVRQVLKEATGGKSPRSVKLKHSRGDEDDCSGPPTTAEMKEYLGRALRIDLDFEEEGMAPEGCGEAASVSCGAVLDGKS